MFELNTFYQAVLRLYMFGACTEREKYNVHFEMLTEPLGCISMDISQHQHQRYLSKPTI
jgi:hypothetical protein